MTETKQFKGEVLRIEDMKQFGKMGSIGVQFQMENEAKPKYFNTMEPGNASYDIVKGVKVGDICNVTVASSTGKDGTIYWNIKQIDVVGGSPIVSGTKKFTVEETVLMLEGAWKESLKLTDKIKTETGVELPISETGTNARTIFMQQVK
jgi:hypothetical protein